MISRERQWIVNIQLNQLKCENPFLDDYYYTVFNQKKELAEAAAKDEMDTAANKKDDKPQNSPNVESDQELVR